MTVVDTIGDSLAAGWWMFWETLWALVLGFGLSGAVQAFVSRARMQASLGDHRPRTIAKAGVDLDLVYVATRNRVVFGAADLDGLKSALQSAS